MLRRLISLAAATIACLALACATPQASALDRGGRSGGGASVRAHKVRFIARLAAPGVRSKGNVDYREQMVRGVLQQKFKVEVERFAPNTVLEVRINGSVFRTITTNSLGRAHVELTTNTPDDNPHDEDLPLPTDFPRLGAGTVVTVGPLSGTLVRK